jgi:diguanylate cyclase (GGDEF)-like protein/PAS domain S-box-containing protein
MNRYGLSNLPAIGWWSLVAGAILVLLGLANVWDEPAARALDAASWTLSALLAAALAWTARRRAAPAHARGLGWIAAGLTAFALGWLVRVAQRLAGFTAPVTPADLLDLCLGPCVAIGLLLEGLRLADRVERKTLLLDAAMLAVVVTMLVFALYLPAHGAPSWPVVLAAAPSASLFVAAGIGLIVAPAVRLRFSIGYAVFLLALVLTGLAWMMRAGLPEGRSAFGGLAVPGVLGLGLALSFWRIERSDNVRWDRWSEALLRLLPLVAVVIAGLAVLLLHGQDSLPARVHDVISLGALAVVVLAVTKQSMVLREHELLKTLTRNLAESEREKYLILNAIPDLVWLKDVDGRYQMCNRGFERLFGEPEAAIVGKTDFDFIDAAQARSFRERDQEAMTAGRPLRDDAWVVFSDGHRALLETLKTPLSDTRGRLIGVLGIARDITEREQANRQLALVDFALNHVREAAFLIDEEGAFHYVNDEACRVLDYPREHLLRLRVTDIDGDCDTPEQWRTTWAQLRLQNTMTFESVHQPRAGAQFPVEVSATYFEFSGQAYVLNMVRDITERKQVEEQIWNLAYFDALTRLPNRRLLMDRLGHALASSHRSRIYGALLILDLDHFKTLNDTQGHDVGDRLLVEVAERLTASVREEDSVCRLGGDEFVVVLEGLGQGENLAARQAELVAEKIRQALGRPYVLPPDDVIFHGTTSIGVTLFCDRKLSAEVLLKQADVALYQAKDAGRNQIRFFNPQMQAAIDSRTVMEAALRLALERNEFRLYYQPQIDQHDRLVGVEALLRWQTPGQQTVSPADFIPLAEDKGLILSIGQWVLDTACAQLKAWSADPRTRALQISVNVSARQFHQTDFVESVRHSLAASGVDPSRLKLELTESVVLDEVDAVVNRMQELIEIGVGFCLDDFGTGYSSLSYLKRLPLERVKIDQSFVRDVTEDQNDAAIVRAIMAISRSLGLEVVAEGVETPAQRAFLLENGCTIYQGFLFCRPTPIEAWADCLARFREADA